jgi:hypothetical protein
MLDRSLVHRYRLIVETNAAAFADPDDLLITIEAALDAERRYGETAAVDFDRELGQPSDGMATEPSPDDLEYIKQRHLEKDPYYYIDDGQAGAEDRPS